MFGMATGNQLHNRNNQPRPVTCNSQKFRVQSRFEEKQVSSQAIYETEILGNKPIFINLEI